MKVLDDLVLVDREVVIHQVEQLFLHQVHFLLAKHLRVTTPMFVFRGRVVEVFRGDNKRREEDAMPCARHTLGDFRETITKTFEVDQRREQGRDLDVGLFADDRDEGFE